MTLVDNYFPFETGQGSSASQARWRVMARNFVPSGVVPGYLNSMAPSLAGSVVTIGLGGAWIDGFYGEITSSTPPKNVTVSSGGGMVVACADPIDHSVKIFFRPAQVNPTQPTNGSGIYEIPLAQIAGTTTFTMTDIRQYAYGSVMPCAKAAASVATNTAADGFFQVALVLTFVKGGMTFASNAITVFTPGTYRVGGSIMYQNGSNAAPVLGRYITTIRVNNIEQIRHDFYLTTSGQFPHPHCSSLLNLNRGDVITLWGYIGNGSATAGSYPNGAYTFLDAMLVSR